MSDMITISETCRIIGGDEKPIHPATYYRGVAAGRYPAPIRVSPHVARVSRSKLLAVLERMVEGDQIMRTAPRMGRRAEEILDDSGAHRDSTPRSCSQASSSRSHITDSVWRGLDLHLGRSKRAVLTLVADDVHRHLYRIRYPNGWMSTPANLARAKDAAYGHGRYLLGPVTPSEGCYSPGTLVADQWAVVTAFTYAELAELCGGKFGKTDVACPLCGPHCKSGLNRKHKTLAIWRKEDDFLTYNCARCGVSGYAHDNDRKVSYPQSDEIKKILASHRALDQADREQRAESARQIWTHTVPLAGTLGHKYLTEIRGLTIDRLDLDDVLR